MKQSLKVICLGTSVLLFCGCDRDIGQSFFDDIKTLKEENQTLQYKVDELEKENRQLNEQVDTLSTLKLSDRQKVFPIVEKITLSRRTGFIDRDKDQIKEGLVVYVIPFDKAKDSIKAAGKLSVQLWDLEKSANGAKLYNWEISSAELGELWANAFTSNYYKLDLNINPDKMQIDKQYTLKVKFTDYISGRVFDTQKVVVYAD